MRYYRVHAIVGLYIGNNYYSMAFVININRIRGNKL